MKGIIIFLFISFFSQLQAQHNHVLVVFSNQQAHTDRQELRQLFDKHLEYLDSLRLNNKLEAYGTFENGGSVAIIRSSDIRAVRDIMAKNPILTSQAFRAEYFHTHVRFGGFCPNAEGDMVRYNFVSYTSHITKFNVQHVPQLLKAHDDYLKEITATGNVLLEGVFSNSDGGFLIIKGDLAKEVITGDPTYLAGFTIPDIKDIFITSGMLCGG